MTTKVIKFENGNVMEAIGDDSCTKRSSRANSNNNILTYWCGKPTPLGVGWIALNTIKK